jgi:hypothetical protein
MHDGCRVTLPICHACRKKLEYNDESTYAYCPEHVNEHRPKVVADMLPPRKQQSDEEALKYFKEAMEEAWRNKPIKTLAEDQKDLAPEIVDHVNEHFWELLDEDGDKQAVIVRGSVPHMCYGEIRRAPHNPTPEEIQRYTEISIERKSYPRGGK